MWRAIVSGVVVLAGGCAGSSASLAEPASTSWNGGFSRREVTLPDGRTRAFSVFIPRDYTATRPWPAIVFLHGLGEGGTDGTQQTTVGLGPYVRKHAATFEQIVIFPQSGGLWSSDDSESVMLACLENIERGYNVDRQRVYLTGVSVGGSGVWKFGATHGDRFAAIAPLCGRSGEAYASQLTRMPIWAFHNSLDPVVWSSATRNTVDAINKQGGHARATIYKAFAHDCWTRTYRDPAFWSWLLAQDLA